ncbi:RING-H2 finger protein ATL67-like isoform X2 [Papaver somniferum]|uniref:RING-H2 finger protein ATL67-like isoform X2 n=1 Tax=Papaver somniferum TaxID=3469 RepID=UPI000E6F7338|nr:RING-H2 finger protein ATL67-like isoform X2 [Papaver somniferum]
MSNTTPIPTPSASSTTTNTTSSTSPAFLTNLGLGYAIAIALGFLVLLSTLLLASYVCCRARARNRNNNHQSHHHHQSDHVSHSNNGIILPRIIFVAEDDDEENGMRADEENIVMGLDQMVINSYPRFCYCKNEKDFGKENDSVCSICLCDYKDGEMLRMMPDCRHYFHLMCVDAWLRLNPSCPVCRNSPLPTPLSTPLSELVPLSHYPAGNRRR